MNLVEELREFKNIKALGQSIGLQLKLPIDSRKMLEGMGHLAQEFSDLSVSKFNEENGYLLISNDAKESELLQYIGIFDSTKFEYRFASKVEIDETSITKFFDVIQSKININRINISYFDHEIYTISDLKVNYNELIWELLYYNTPISGLFKTNQIYGDETVIKSVINENTVARFYMFTNIGRKNIHDQDFSDAKLQMELGIAKTSEIALDNNLARDYIQHYKISLEFIKTVYIPSTLKNINEKINSFVSE